MFICASFFPLITSRTRTDKKKKNTEPFLIRPFAARFEACEQNPANGWRAFVRRAACIQREAGLTS